MSFFELWWSKQSNERKELIKRLEGMFFNGCMQKSDEKLVSSKGFFDFTHSVGLLKSQKSRKSVYCVYAWRS
jgi:hypothetical protein